jgi:hypothetical protein
VFKRFTQILALAVPLLFVACNGTSTTTPDSGGGGGGTTASYTGTYTGTTTGVNGGPTTMVIAADKTIKGTFTINNRTTDQGVPTVYEATFDGKVDAAGKISVNSYLEGALVMIFSGSIDSSGLLKGTYFEAAHPGDPAKSGAFSLQGPKNGTTTTKPTTGGSAKSCYGSYVGGYEPPDHDERIRLRNLSLAGRGVPVTGNDDIDNANAGGGAPDGGIWMAGSLSFETDGNCNVVSGQTLIFYAYEYGVSGTINKDGSFNLIWSGQGSQGDIVGKIDANNNVTGKFFHPAPDNFVYGVISGKFNPK